MTVRDTYADDFDQPERRRRKKKRPPKRGLPAWVWLGLLVVVGVAAYFAWMKFGQ